MNSDVAQVRDWIKMHVGEVREAQVQRAMFRPLSCRRAPSDGPGTLTERPQNTELYPGRSVSAQQRTRSGIPTTSRSGLDTLPVFRSFELAQPEADPVERQSPLPLTVPLVTAAAGITGSHFTHQTLLGGCEQVYEY